MQLVHNMNRVHVSIIIIYYNSNLGEYVFPLVWDVIKTLELYDIPVVSLTSDGAKKPSILQDVPVNISKG